MPHVPLFYECGSGSAGDSLTRALSFAFAQVLFFVSFFYFFRKTFLEICPDLEPSK
jgi:hypothetical protein